MNDIILDDEPGKAANTIHDRAATLAGSGNMVVIALPHEPPRSDEYMTGYMLADGNVLWSLRKAAPTAMVYRKKVTTFLREFYGVRVVSMTGSVTLEDIQALFDAHEACCICQ